MKLDPATTFVRSLPGTYYMVREAAAILGVSHRTLRKLNESTDPEHSALKPSFIGKLGQVRIYLYTEDDLNTIREYMSTRRRVFPNQGRTDLPMGRPARFTKEERKVRQRLYSKAHYYGKRAEEELDKGDMEKAGEYLSKKRQVQKELTEWPPPTE